MTGDKLTVLIEKEKKNIEKYKSKRAEYDEKIRKSQAKLQEYEMLQNNEKFNALTNLVNRSGLSIEDVFDALKSGNLLDLQEQIEAAQKADEEKMNNNMDGEEVE